MLTRFIKVYLFPYPEGSKETTLKKSDYCRKLTIAGLVMCIVLEKRERTTKRGGREKTATETN